MTLFIGSVCLLLITEVCQGSIIPTFELSNGNRIPAIGLGTFLLSGEQVDPAITAALENGYRYIDAAFLYNNEPEIGKALKKWLDNGGNREDLFLLSKLPISAMRPSDVTEALELTLKNLGVDYLDMYLIHVPAGIYRTADYQMLVYDNGTYAIDNSTDLLAVWKELEKQVKSGKVKSLGFSNVNKNQILRIWENSEIKPSNLQIEINPYMRQEELINLGHKLGMVVTAESPLGSPSFEYMRRKRDLAKLPPVIGHPIVQSIAKKHNKTPAQILLRYNLQRNVVVIPKSSHPERIKENLDVFDFMLTKIDMALLTTLDKRGRYRKYNFLTLKG
ncbi:hypothetical protein TSAR_007039 [Trichomalopsis sarcophagae]|uniref:NADP-dependent oxidoreductase domain-containing protein n=1 Tax=Trichomalopsis sarcophagae TaxID=543379 RepID=A0A232EVE6_9HYME|nr:hypothetical protein TSAR_007039 [Trichomalopsis sarcophagae]